MKLRFYLFIGLLFVLVGGLLGSQWLVKDRSAQIVAPAVVAAAPTPVAPSAISGEPNHLRIPSLNISVEVAPGYYNPQTQQWTLTTTKAHFATVTTPPNNQSGNTFIYGHNRPEVFSKLLKIKPGETVIVSTANHHTFTYVFDRFEDVKPTDTSIFSQTGGPPRLTMQTCSGLWYQNRRLFHFSLVEVQ